MKLTDEGLDLIKRFEGFRPTAYQDATGVWTIGYGHTAMAGRPVVTAGMVITREQGDEILARDAGNFAEGVSRLVKRKLDDRQFSALVCFAFNVGLKNFKSSSVLKAVNAGNMTAASRRLQLWVKAGGRVLPGLVRRRAAEAAMLAAEEKDNDTPLERAVESIKGKSIFSSTTSIATILAALSGTATALAGSFKDIATVTGGQPVALVLMGIMLAASGWVVWQRHRKSAEDGV